MDGCLQDIVISSYLYSDDIDFYEEVDVHIEKIINVDFTNSMKTPFFVSKNEDYLIPLLDNSLGKIKREFLRIQEFMLSMFPTVSHVVFCYFIWENNRIPVVVFYYENMDIFFFCVKQQNDSYFKFN